MRILIAEDDAVSRRMIEAICRSWGLDPVPVSDGEEAWESLQEADAPPIALLDWMMPGIDGLEVVRRVRARQSSKPVYIILLTARGSREDVVRGLLAEADDSVTKPVDHRERRARVQVGVRMVELQRVLAARVAELEAALSCLNRLQGLLPICAYCKRIRNDRNYWQRVESYITEHSEAEFTHGVCPQCYEMVVKPEIDRLPAI